jgi:L-fucose mutarotase
MTSESGDLGLTLTRRTFVAGSAALLAVGASAAPPDEFYPSRQKEGSGMLKGISPVISPDLLKTLAEMGHGDEIVISDAHFPGHTFNPRTLRADGIGADRLLAGIIPLFELDAYATPVVMMAAVPGDTLDPSVEAKYRKALGYSGTIERVERFAFYERAKKAYAVVISGETAKYGNIILKKGVTPVS